VCDGAHDRVSEEFWGKNGRNATVRSLAITDTSTDTRVRSQPTLKCGVLTLGKASREGLRTWGKRRLSSLRAVFSYLSRPLVTLLFRSKVAEVFSANKAEGAKTVHRWPCSLVLVIFFVPLVALSVGDGFEIVMSHHTKRTDSISSEEAEPPARWWIYLAPIGRLLRKIRSESRRPGTGFGWHNLT
jgi:hypothetical protein